SIPRMEGMNSQRTVSVIADPGCLPAEAVPRFDIPFPLIPTEPRLRQLSDSPNRESRPIVRADGAGRGRPVGPLLRGQADDRMGDRRRRSWIRWQALGEGQARGLRTRPWDLPANDNGPVPRSSSWSGPCSAG